MRATCRGSSLPAAISLFLLLLLACHEHNDSNPNPAGVQVDTLVFADSIGVLMGDSCFEFGTLDAVIPVPEGTAVLDGVFCRISVFDDRGEIVRSRGRQGSGPGEFSSPFTMCRLNSGEYFVFDFGSRRTTLLDDTLGYLDGSPTSMSLPLSILPGADSMVVIQEMAIEIEEGGVLGGFRVYSMNAYTGEEETTFARKMLPLGADEVDLKPWFPIFTADGEGNVYMAGYDSDEYGIVVVSPRGDTLRSITVEADPREEFDRETSSLVRLPITMPISYGDVSSILRISYPEYQPYVTALTVDGDGNIWVRRIGLADSETWDVLTQEGDLVRKVILFADTTGTGSYPELHISQYGMAATFGNEDEFERFFLVEYTDSDPGSN